jgi:hypothetical protein
MGPGRGQLDQELTIDSRQTDREHLRARHREAILSAAMRTAETCTPDRPNISCDTLLAMARRLAGVPELFAAAAEQCLPVAGAVDDAAERRVVVGLLRRAADQAALIGTMR